MRIYKTIFTGILITIMAIGYVHQRVEIIKAGYSLQKSRKYLAYLAEQNSNLMFDLSKMESPKFLLAALRDEEIEFAKTRSRKTERYQLAYAVLEEDKAGNDGVIGRILDLFTVNAEARTRK